MPKLIKDFDSVTCVGVEPASEERAANWGTWRLDAIGLVGHLCLYESERKYPGGQFLCFYGRDWDEECHGLMDWDLRTSYGDLTVFGNSIIFCTKNSRYSFQKCEKSFPM